MDVLVKAQRMFFDIFINLALWGNIRYAALWFVWP
jgi:hypothetical protein